MHIKSKAMNFLLTAALGAAAVPAALAGATPAMAAGSADFTISVEDLSGNPITEVAPGDQFQVKVNVDTGADQTYGMQYALNWTNGSLVEYDEPATEGDFYDGFSTLGPGWADPEQTDDPGVGPLVATSIYGTPKPAGPSGSGWLGTHFFTALGDGTVDFSFNTAEMADGDGNPMTAVNFTGDSLDIVGPKPDLTVTEKSESWVSGTDYVVDFTVKNIGDAACAGTCQAGVSVDGPGVEVFTVSALGVGAEESFTSAPITMSDDFDVILVQVDIGTAIDESDETNNTLENTFTAEGAATLTVEVQDMSGNPIDEIVAGDPFQVEVTIDSTQTYGMQYALDWTAGMASYNEPATPGDFYTSHAAGLSPADQVIVMGYLNGAVSDGEGPLCAHSLYGYTKPEGPMGSGSLGTHFFTADSAGTVDFGLANVGVTDGFADQMGDVTVVGDSLDIVNRYDLDVLKKSERWLNGYDDFSRPLFVVTFKVQNLGAAAAPATVATITTSDGQEATVDVPALAPGEITHPALEMDEADAFFYTCGEPMDITVAVTDDDDRDDNDTMVNTIDMDCADIQHIAAVVEMGTLELEVEPFVNMDLNKGETTSKDMLASVTADMPWALMVEDIDITGDSIAPDIKDPALRGKMVSSNGEALTYPLYLTYGLAMQDLTSADIILAEGIGPAIVDYNLVQKVDYNDHGGTYEIVLLFTLVPQY